MFHGIKFSFPTQLLDTVLKPVVYQSCILFYARSIERAAEHEAKRTEQMAKGMLERQKLTNEKVSLRPLGEIVHEEREH